MAHVLVIDRQPSVRLALRRYLEARGHTCAAVADATQATRDLAQRTADLVVIEAGGTETEGYETLAPQIAAIPCVVTVAPEAAMPPPLVARTDLHRVDRPIDFPRFGDVVDAALHRPRTVELPADPAPTDGFVWRSEAMAAVDAKIERLASFDIPVLITGESGTGKEVVARALHRRSDRADAPFVAVHCGAIPGELLESELFGHEKGSFTDAHRTHVGRFEAAGKGTLLLDEIGEMPLELQAKLLRVLQEKEIVRVGGESSRPIHARILAATHRDLEAEVRAGRFRLDLFHRLAVATIWIPPLRERQDDIPRLAAVILGRLASDYGRRLPGFTRGAVEWLRAQSWPGNVRELENVLRRAAVLENEGVLDRQHLASALDAPTSSREEAWAAPLRAWLEAGRGQGRSPEALRSELLTWFDSWESGGNQGSESDQKA